MRYVVCLAAVAGLSSVNPRCGQCQGDEQPLVLKESNVVFASAEQGIAALTRRDDFVKSLSQFDLESRLRTNGETSVDRWLKSVAGEVLEWNGEEKKRLSVIVRAVNERLKPRAVPLPESILLVKTTGNEEGRAAYCRQNAIVLPTNMLRGPNRSLEQLLTHELFHVISSHHPDLRRRLYQVVGFEICAEIKLPPELESRKITNPDAPLINCRIEVEHNGAAVHAAPMLLADPPRYDANRGGTFFRYMKFRLLLIEPAGDSWAVRLEEGKPVLLDPTDTPSYMDKIGRNTRYIVHPDEILADNFVYLVHGRMGLPTPRIIEQMDEIFTRQ